MFSVSPATSRNYQECRKPPGLCLGVKRKPCKARKVCGLSVTGCRLIRVSYPLRRLRKPLLWLRKRFLPLPKRFSVVRTTEESKEKRMNKDFKGLRNFFDGDDPFMVAPLTTNIRKYPKKIPDWMYDEQKIQNFLLGVFPKLKTSRAQLTRASRWYQVIQLYFRQGFTARQTAAEMNEGWSRDITTPTKVKQTALRITRVGQGWRSDGKKEAGVMIPRGRRPRGRQRKLVASI